jgi:hypothetical protein
MNKMIIILIASVCSPIARAGNFFSTMPKSEYVYDAFELADISTTLDIKNHPNLYETNPLLGRHPSDSAIFAEGIGLGIIGHALVTHELVAYHAPSWVIDTWEDVSIGVEAGYTANNLSYGLQFTY